MIIGPKMSEEEGTQWAYAHLDVAFDIVPLNTRDRARATSQLKARRLDTEGNLGQALQRARHKIPENTVE